MTDMSEIIELFAEAMDKAQLQLPDRFFNEAISEKMWTKILPPSYKIKDYAEALFRASGSSKVRKALKHASPGAALTIFLGSHEHRQFIYSNLDQENPVARELLLERHLPRLLKKLPPSIIEQNDKKLPSEVRQLMPFVFADTLKVLECFLDESAYNNLSHDLKDIADFCLNMILVRSNSYRFIADYLDSAPWLKKNQTTLYEAAVSEVTEPEQDPGQVLRDGVDIWGMMATQIESQLSDVRMLGLDEALGIDALMQRFYSDCHYSPAAVISSSLVHDQGRVRRSARRFLSFIENVDAKINEEALEQLRERSELADEIVELALNDETRRILAGYVEAISGNHTVRKSKTEDFEGVLQRRQELKGELATIINSNDSHGMSRIPELSLNLQEVVKDINDSAQEIADGIIRNFKIIDETVVSLNALREPQRTPELNVGMAMESGPIIAEQLSRAPEIEAIHNEMTLIRQQLEVAHVHENELMAINDHLAEEIVLLKKLRHEARFSASDTYGDVAPGVGGQWLRTLLKGEGRLTPEEVLQAYSNLAPDRLVLLPSAIKSSRESANFEMPHRLAQMIDNLVYAYLDNIRSGQPDSEAKGVLGNRYAANESKTVSGNKRLRAQREFEYEGQSIYFRQHIGIGSGYGTQHALRIHFKVIDERIVIAYCGEHLETMRSN